MAIEADWHGTAAQFLAADPAHLVAALAAAAQRRHRENGPQQIRAWHAQVEIMTESLRHLPQSSSWYLLFEATLPRAPRRADAVVLAGDAIVVLEFKIGATQFDNAARQQVDDFALDLQDFHAGSHGRRIVPVLVASGAVNAARLQASLTIDAVLPVQDATSAELAHILAASVGHSAPIEPGAWRSAPYRPVPPIIDAARALYARHNVDDIIDARAGAISLARTSDAIRAALAAAQSAHHHVILFVTGVPGAGKTLCGLNACFGAARDDLRATFLTGNPSLVHVLREALIRDAVAQGMARPAAAQQMQGVIQMLPVFRDLYASNADAPPERVIVVDEAQRSWSRAYAVRKSQDRAVQLHDSEPGHLLAAMARHPDWAVIICLVGNGQEIHDGEGGLAEWGVALSGAHGAWRAIAAPDCLEAADPRRRLPPLANLRTDARLHLSVATRHIGSPAAADWVEAVLEGDAAAASAIADHAAGVPFYLTRDQTALRQGLRQLARGTRRAGLIASSGARRLRAVGLGVELPHIDASAVARWFLDRWPMDVRASDALEVVATEFAVQGLELDVVGLCWDTDLARATPDGPWRPRVFSGKQWGVSKSAEKMSNRVNTYRVLLTRARHATVIYVPVGCAEDATRDPRELDAIATFLLRCGVRPLQLTPPEAAPNVARIGGLFASEGPTDV